MQWPSKLSTEFKGFDLWFKKQGKKKGGGFFLGTSRRPVMKQITSP